MKSLTTLLLLISTFSHSWAQETEQNKKLGIEFEYFSNWVLTEKPDGYLLGSEKIEGFIIIRVESYKSLKAMKSSMKEGIKKEDGTMLTLASELRPYGENALAGMYEGVVDEKKVRGFLIGKLEPKSKKSVFAIVVAPEERFNQSHMDAVKIIGRTLKFL